MRIAVCGCRDYQDRDAVWAEIRSLINRVYGGKIILHGGCPTGPDRFAHEFCNKYGEVEEVFQAEWKVYGRAAGPKRNQRMMFEGKPDLVLAFWDGVSPGTRSAIHCAVQAGIPVEIYPTHPRGGTGDKA